MDFERNLVISINFKFQIQKSHRQKSFICFHLSKPDNFHTQIKLVLILIDQLKFGCMEKKPRKK